jgi:hypothetical protein
MGCYDEALPELTSAQNIDVEIDGEVEIINRGYESMPMSPDRQNESTAGHLTEKRMPSRPLMEITNSKPETAAKKKKKKQQIETAQELALMIKAFNDNRIET